MIMADLCVCVCDCMREKLKKAKQIQPMLWLGFSKLLKVLIMDENMKTFMECAKVKVSIFL